MTPKEAQDRTRIIRDIHGLLMGNVFQKQWEAKLKELSDIADEHKIMSDASIAAFLYEGRWYMSPWNALPDKDTSRYTRSLHPTLRAKVCTILKKDFEEIELQAHIRNYLGNILETAKTMNCLKAMLPQGMCPIFTAEMDILFNIGDPLTHKELQEFSINNLKGASALKQLYMVELLMAKG